MMVLYWGTTAKAMLLGIINLAWYNIVYTPLKRKTAFALLAGAFNGAIPPIIGWTAAGGQITDWQVILIASFMYLWQIPHFWLLSIRYADDYKQNKIPLFNLMMRESLVNRIFFIWIFGTTLSTMVFPVAGMITSPYRIVALLFIDAGIIGYFASMVFNKTIFKPKVASLVLNGFQILILFLLLVEASL